jgi:hypothetical protein
MFEEIKSKEDAFWMAFNGESALKFIQEEGLKDEYKLWKKVQIKNLLTQIAQIAMKQVVGDIIKENLENISSSLKKKRMTINETTKRA